MGILASVRRSETSNKTPAKAHGLPTSRGRVPDPTTDDPAESRGQASNLGGGLMRHAPRYAVGAVAFVLLSGSAAVAQSPAAPTEAWTQSSVLAGFDPLAVDLTGSTPGPNGEQSVAAADVPDPTAECIQQIKDAKLKLAFLNGYAGISWMSAIEAGVQGQGSRVRHRRRGHGHRGLRPAQGGDGRRDPDGQRPRHPHHHPGRPGLGRGRTTSPPSTPARPSCSTTTRSTAGPPARSTSRIVTGDHYRMGKDAADLLAEALGDTGTYGFIQYDVAVLQQQQP